MTEEERLAKEKAEEAAKAAAEEAKRKEDEEKNKSKTLTFEEHQKAINEVVAEREKLKEKFRDTRDKLASLEKRLEGVPSGEELKKILAEKKELEDYKKKIQDESLEGIETYNENDPAIIKANNQIEEGYRKAIIVTGKQIGRAHV